MTGKGSRALVIAVAGVAAALPVAVYCWGFMVDDAFIIARYAHHLRTGVGYRFNVGGPVTDGVTPLGFAWLLAPFGSTTLGAYRAAKWLGLICWLLGAGALSLAVDRLPIGRRKWAGMGLLVVSAPLGAWSVAGMETGLVAGLGAAAAAGRALGRERLATTAAGLVAALRPEAILWAMALALAPATGPETHSQMARRRWWGLLRSAGPAAVVAATRFALFGRALPLALLAKPPEWHHGVAYALACLWLTGPLALIAWRRLPPWVHGLQIATAVHFGALALCGGDWMPLSRLAIPALPTLVIAACFVAGATPARWAVPRLVLALAGELFVLITIGPRAAAVEPKRLAVITQLRPAMTGCQQIAALDIGWVGATTESAVLDLAGVTDPAVAALPGGHTTKRVPPTLLTARGVDCLVLLLKKGSHRAAPWTATELARPVEQRVAQIVTGWDLRPVAISAPPLRYLVLRRPAATH